MPFNWFNMSKNMGNSNTVKKAGEGVIQHDFKAYFYKEGDQSKPSLILIGILEIPNLTIWKLRL